MIMRLCLSITRCNDSCYFLPVIKHIDYSDNFVARLIVSERSEMLPLFQAEWEALEIVSHEWLLDDVEERLMKEYSCEKQKKEKDKEA